MTATLDLEPTQRSSNPKTLIIEDSRIHQDLFKHYLTSKNIQDISIASNGDKALLRFKQAIQSNQPFEMILLDYYLPDALGRAVIQSLRAIEREQDQKAYIVIATVCNETHILIETLSLGADDFLVKPIKQYCFGQLIESYLNDPASAPKAKNHKTSVQF